MKPIIETQNLAYAYGKKSVFQNINLSVPEGSIYALLGPNGAGKTTLIQILMNLIQPKSGSASILGKTSTRLGPVELAQIGYVSENQKMPEWMTVRQLLDYCKPFYPTWDDGFVENLQKQFQLPWNEKIKNLSRGMKIKASLLSSIAYRPKLLVLDEPFSGLDPLVRLEFIQGILELTENQTWSVLISSHDIEEVERLADWIGILDHHELIVNEPIVNLQSRFRTIEVITEDPDSPPVNLPDSIYLMGKSGKTVSLIDTHYQEETCKEIISNSFPKHTQFTAHPMSLRDIYLGLMKHQKQSQGIS